MNYPIHIRIQDESDEAPQRAAHAADPRIPNTDNGRAASSDNHPLTGPDPSPEDSGIPNIGEYPELADLLRMIEKTINEHHGDDRSTLHESDIPNTDTDVQVDMTEEDEFDDSDEDDEDEDFFRHTSVTGDNFIPNMGFFPAAQLCEFTKNCTPEDPGNDDIPNTELSRPVDMAEDFEYSENSENSEDLLDLEIGIFGILEPRDVFIFTENGVMIRTSVEFYPKKMVIVMEL